MSITAPIVSALLVISGAVLMWLNRRPRSKKTGKFWVALPVTGMSRFLFRSGVLLLVLGVIVLISGK